MNILYSCPLNGAQFTGKKEEQAQQRRSAGPTRFDSLQQHK